MTALASLHISPLAVFVYMLALGISLGALIVIGPALAKESWAWMQAHLGPVAIEIDEAGLRQKWVIGYRPPQIEKNLRNSWPGLARDGMSGLIAIAAIAVRHPTERT